MSATVAAIIAGMAGFATAAFNAYQQNNTNKQLQAYARENAQIAQQNSKDLLDYNSPSYQMQRFVNAGLNPNLIYDNMSDGVPSGAQPDTPQFKAPQLSSTGIDDALKVAQIERLNAASDNETKLTDSEIAKNYKSLDLMDSTIKELYAHASFLDQSIIESQSRVRVYSEEQRGKALDNAFKGATFENNVKLIENSLKVSTAEAENIMRYINAKCLGLESQAKMYLSQVHVNEEYKETLEALAHLYTMQSDLVVSQTTGQNLRNSQDAWSVNVGNESLFPGSYYSVGQWNAKQNFKQNVIRTEFVSEQNRLLHKFGGAERTANVINTYSQAFESTSNAVSNLMPFFGSQTQTRQLYGSGTKTVTKFGF